MRDVRRNKDPTALGLREMSPRNENNTGICPVKPFAHGCNDTRQTHPSTVMNAKHEPANAFSEPVITMAPTPSSLSASSSAALSSVNKAALSALSAFGLFSVMSETAGCGVETRILA